VISCDLCNTEILSNPVAANSVVFLHKTRRGSRKRGKKKPPPPYYSTLWGDELPKNVVNLSSYQPTNAEKTILSLGLGFGVASRHDPVRVLRDLRVFESRIRGREFFVNPRNREAVAAMERKKFENTVPSDPNKRTYNVRYRKSQEESAIDKGSKNHVLETFLSNFRKRTRKLIFKKIHFQQNLSLI
jgi:hypothetical protein